MCRIRVTIDEGRALIGRLVCFPSFFLLLFFFFGRGARKEGGKGLWRWLFEGGLGIGIGTVVEKKCGY